jgi:hypothetical protein
MEITVRVKNVYGKELVYVVDAIQRANLSTLTGSKTLTSAHIACLKGLGFTFTDTSGIVVIEHRQAYMFTFFGKWYRLNGYMGRHTYQGQLANS